MTFTGYVYKITGACGLVYIGSTIDMKNRKYQHNTSTNKCSSKLLKKPLQFDIIDTREYTLIRTLHLIEQFYLDNTNTINQKRAYNNERSLMYLLRKRKHYSNYNKKNKEKRKINRDNNKEKKKEKNRIYQENNKERISESKKVKIICECGSLIRKCAKVRHTKSKKHLKLINLLNS